MIFMKIERDEFAWMFYGDISSDDADLSIKTAWIGHFLSFCIKYEELDYL